MKIGGLQSFSLSDFPGKVAAVVFTQGCNFLCPFCHNGALIPMSPITNALIPENEVCHFLKSRVKQLDGVVICGGEPTLQPDLPSFLRKAKALGFEIKLDTNGSRPEVLRALLQEGLLDFIAMDIKAPLAIYDRLTGVHAPTKKVGKSIELIAGSGMAHEFRTTVVRSLLSPVDIQEIQAMVPPGSPHRLQEFHPENALDFALRNLSIPQRDPEFLAGVDEVR